MKRVAFPFLTLSDDAVQAAPWELALNRGEFSVALDYLPDWDIASTIEARRSLCVDFALAEAEVGVNLHDLRLVVVASVGTGSGNVPRHTRVCQRLALNADEAEAQLKFELPSALSMVVHLMTDVILADVASEHDELAPCHLGDRLWAHHQRVRLEGQELRFPIEAVDLSGALGDATVESAPWFAHWNRADWSRDFHGAFRLYLNSNALEIGQVIEDESGLVLQAMMADVMSQLCEGLLREEDPSAEDILAECEPGSMGAQARWWIDIAWPGRDLGFVRSVLRHTPNRFRAAILATARTIRQETE